MEDYTGKYKGEQVEVALFGGEYQEGVLTAYCYIEDVAHLELNGHILIPLQNIASLHCSSRCDAPKDDWPPRGLAEPREGLAPAHRLLRRLHRARLDAWRLPARVDLPLLRAPLGGRPRVLRRPRRARDGRRARVAPRRRADRPFDYGTPIAARGHPETAALPARRSASPSAFGGTRHARRSGRRLTRPARGALAGRARGRARARTGEDPQPRRDGSDAARRAFGNGHRDEPDRRLARARIAPVPRAHRRVVPAFDADDQARVRRRSNGRRILRVAARARGCVDPARADRRAVPVPVDARYGAALHDQSVRRRRARGPLRHAPTRERTRAATARARSGVARKTPRGVALPRTRAISLQLAAMLEIAAKTVVRSPPFTY